MDNDKLFTCPHCDGIITISKLRCGIFRHGIMKKTGKCINPHTSKIDCEKLIRKNLIYGCGKPFQIIEKKDNDKETIVYDINVCDYL